MLTLKHFPVNAAYGYVLGTDLRTARPFNLAGEPLLFPTRSAAVDAAARKGLHVARDGAVTVAVPTPSTAS